MSVKIYWLCGFIALYWLYCLYWGVRGMRAARTATDYFLAGRRIPGGVFIMTVTAASFSGWIFIGHPGPIFDHGLPDTFAAFCAIMISLAGVLFLKRQWMLGKRFGYVTPGDMFADYFKGDGIRILTLIAALLFSIPYLGVQFRASGFLVEDLTGGLIPLETGMWMSAAIMLLYVVSGGWRAVACVGTVQCLLLIAGLIMTGIITIGAIITMGGWEAFRSGLTALTGSAQTGAPLTGRGEYVGVPGVIRFTAGGGAEDPMGGIGTGLMIMSHMIALLGVQAAPAFSMWAFGSASPRPFAPQQVWAGSLMMGAVLFLFAASRMLPTPEYSGMPVSAYVSTLCDDWPWLAGLLSVCVLAAMHSTGASHLSAAGAMLTRDLYKRYLHPTADHPIQKFFGRICAVLITLAALLTASFTADTLVLLGSLALAFGVQLLPGLAGICYVPWLTRQGCTYGLMAGFIMAAATESVGVTLQSWILDAPLWGRWPLTIHSAVWGLAVNVIVTLILSATGQGDQAGRTHRTAFHDFLRAHAQIPPHKRKLLPLAWVICIAWTVMAMGPGAVIGTWIFGIPSPWAWQILFWLLGVGVMWFLAYKMELSTLPEKSFEALVEDIGDIVPGPRQ